MKKMILCAFVSMIFVFGLSGTVYAQNNDPSVEELTRLSIPGIDHEVLKMFVGDWKQESILFVEGEPQNQKGTATIEGKMVLGGRFIELRSTGKMFGMQSNGIKFMGYDNRIKQYFLFAIDDMGTCAVNAFGSYNKEAQMLVFTGEEYDPSGKVKSPFRITYHFMEDGSILSEFFFSDPSTGSEVLYMTYLMKKV